MKRLVAVILMILFLSACHSQRFTYDTAQINLDKDLSDVLDLMMDKGNYDDGLLVPYNRTSLYIDYSTNKVVVEAVQFQVLRTFKDGEWEYDSTGCFNVEGLLKCKEERGKFTGEKVQEEVLLTWSFELYSKINVSEIVTELKRNYQIITLENTIVQAHLVMPSDIEEDQERFENRVFYYDGEYHYDDSYDPSGMMLEIRVDIFGNGIGEAYIVYFEIDE